MTDASLSAVCVSEAGTVYAKKIHFYFEGLFVQINKHGKYEIYCCEDTRDQGMLTQTQTCGYHDKSVQVKKMPELRPMVAGDVLQIADNTKYIAHLVCHNRLRPIDWRRTTDNGELTLFRNLTRLYAAANPHVDRNQTVCVANLVEHAGRPKEGSFFNYDKAPIRTYTLGYSSLFL